MTVYTNIENYTPKKYKTSLKIGPFRNAGFASSALPKVKLLLEQLGLHAVRDYRIGNERTDQFYITIELAEDRIPDGVETMLHLMYSQYRDQILGLQMLEKAMFYCPYIPNNNKEIK